MSTKLIELQEGILVQVDIAEDQPQQISSRAAQKVSASVDKVKPILTAVARSVGAAWQEINQEMEVDKATIELGLSFEGEGDIFITKAKAGANLTVTLELTPKQPEATAE